MADKIKCDIKVESLVTIEIEKDSSKATFITGSSNFSFSENVDNSVFLDNKGDLNEDGINTSNHCLIMTICSNIKQGSDKGFLSREEYIEKVISDIKSNVLKM